MNIYEDNFTRASLESYAELDFTIGCINILKIYNKETLITLAQSPDIFSYLSTNCSISEQDVHLFLLKKYFLSEQKENLNLTDLNILIEQMDFDEIEKLMDQDQFIRTTLIKTYIDNINKTNHQLTVKKINKYHYSCEEMDDVLSAMNNYYMMQNYKKSPQLKKVL